MPCSRQPSTVRSSAHHSLPGESMRCQSTVRTGRPDSATGFGTIIPVELIPSDRHLHLSILDGYGVGAHAQTGRGEALAGDDVELDAVPRAGDDLALAHPLESPACRGGAGHRAVDRPRAERTKLMGTDIGEGVKFSIDVEDADLDSPKLHDAVGPWRKLVYRPHDILSHLGSYPLAPITHDPNTPSYCLPAGAVMPKRFSAFSPMILRLASGGIGSFMMVRGWSK